MSDNENADYAMGFLIDKINDVKTSLFEKINTSNVNVVNMQYTIICIIVFCLGGAIVYIIMNTMARPINNQSHFLDQRRPEINNYYYTIPYNGNQNMHHLPCISCANKQNAYHHSNMQNLLLK